MMNSMKHDAIVEQGIPIHERVEIPEDMIPADSRVEIDAKIHAGYCECARRQGRSATSLLTLSTVTKGAIMTMEELSNVHGRAWDDVDVSTATVLRRQTAMQDGDRDYSAN